MMTEKRFSVDDDGIYDNQEKKHFKFSAYDWIECDIYECCEKLNEQQATIDKLDQENADLLGARIKAQEEWEKCTDKLKEKILEQQSIIEAKKEYQQVLEAKIRRLKDRIKILEKAEGWQN